VTKRFLPLLAALPFIPWSTARGQSLLVTATPNQNDFCFNTPVTLTVSPYNPAHTYSWKFEYNAAYSSGGWTSLSYAPFDNGQTILVFPFQFAGTTFILVEETDNLGNPIDYGTFGLGAATGTVPVYFDKCDELSVPTSFSINATFPSTRSAMWYKDGVPTGNSDAVIYKPDSGTYVYQLTFACGSTIYSDSVTINPPKAPVISASGSTAVCQGDTVYLSIPVYYSFPKWYRNGQLVGSGSSYKATVSGSYTVAAGYSVGGSSPICSLVSQPLAVTVNPGAFITAADTTACAGDSIQLSCTPATTYVWKNNGIAIPGATAQIYHATTSGTYTVETTGLVCNASPARTLYVYPYPVISVGPSGSLSLCAGSGMTLSATGTNMFSFQWLRNGAPITGADEADLYVTGPGSYKCQATAPVGCTVTSNSKNISEKSVASLPVKSSTIKPGPNGQDAWISSSIQGQNSNYGNGPYLEVSNWHKDFRTVDRAMMAFDLSGIPADAAIVSARLKFYVDSMVAWTDPSQVLVIKRITAPWNEQTVTFNSQPPTKSYPAVTIPEYKIKSSHIVNKDVYELVSYWLGHPAENHGLMVLSDEANNGHRGWLRIASGDHANAARRPKLLITYTFAKNKPETAVICDGTTVTLSTNAGYPSYQWYKNGSPVAGAVADTYTAGKAANYHVVISNGAGCSAVSGETAVTVLPAPPAAITPLGSTTFCAGGSVQLDANAGTGLAYQWKLNNVSIPAASAISYTATLAGKYKVKVTDAAGCTAISPGVEVFVPCRTPAGGTESRQEGFSVFPNPASSSVTVHLPKSGTLPATVRLIDASGRRVLVLTVDGPDPVIDLSGLDAGPYLLEAETGGSVFRSRLVLAGR